MWGLIVAPLTGFSLFWRDLAVAFKSFNWRAKFVLVIITEGAIEEDALQKQIFFKTTVILSIKLIVWSKVLKNTTGEVVLTKVSK